MLLIIAGCESKKEENKAGWESPVNDQYSFCGEAIVFESSREGSLSSRDVYLSSPDGKYIVRLSSSPADDRLPKISPDGTRVLFRSDREGVNQIYMIDLDLLLSKSPNAEQKLFEFDGSASLASFSPDGSLIVFSGRKENQTTQIYEYNLTTKRIRQLTNQPFNVGFPDMSPDNNKVVYNGNPDGNDEEIFIMDLTSGEVIQVTDNNEDDYFPEWSPDGSKIAFSGQQSGEVYLYNVSDQSIENLTNHPAHDTDPSWRGDGSEIVFASFRTGSDDVWVLNLKTREVRNVTHSHHHGGHGDVSRTNRCYGYL